MRNQIFVPPSSLQGWTESLTSFQITVTIQEIPYTVNVSLLSKFLCPLLKHIQNKETNLQIYEQYEVNTLNCTLVFYSRIEDYLRLCKNQV